MSTILATYPSKSNPAKTYNVVKADDGVTYCTCPAWRLQGGPTDQRPDCKHITEYKRNNAMNVTAHDIKLKGVTVVKVVNHDLAWEKRLEEASRELKQLTGGR